MDSKLSAMVWKLCFETSSNSLFKSGGIKAVTYLVVDLRAVILTLIAVTGPVI